MRVRIPYMARGPGQLTVPGGAMVFLFGEERRDGMASVIYDGTVRRKIIWGNIRSLREGESSRLMQCFC